MGQSWHYTKLDLVTKATVDTEVDRVASVGQAIEIEANLGHGPEAPVVYPDWGTRWSQKYIPATRSERPLPNEIQSPWGMILVDPHWSELQAYEEPIPLWPLELRPGWSKTTNTYYKTPESPDELPWQLTMHAHEWRTIEVPAGRFTALRYSNIINFRYTNVSEKVAAQRLETVWFVPEIGRWAARESLGTFYQYVGERFHENNYRWELPRWT
jgi:hypothetical protein